MAYYHNTGLVIFLLSFPYTDRQSLLPILFHQLMIVAYYFVDGFNRNYEVLLFAVTYNEQGVMSHTFVTTLIWLSS